MQNITVQQSFDVASKAGKITFPARVDLNLEKNSDLTIVLSNDAGEEMAIGYNKAQQQYFIDRSKSGQTSFQKDFSARHVAPRLSKAGGMELSLILDVNSVELFADGGLTVMTSVYFPTKPFTQIRIQSPERVTIKKLTVSHLKSIW